MANAILPLHVYAIIEYIVILPKFGHGVLNQVDVRSQQIILWYR